MDPNLVWQLIGLSVLLLLVVILLRAKLFRRERRVGELERKLNSLLLKHDHERKTVQKAMTIVASLQGNPPKFGHARAELDKLFSQIWTDWRDQSEVMQKILEFHNSQSHGESDSLDS